MDFEHHRLPPISSGGTEIQVKSICQGQKWRPDLRVTDLGFCQHQLSVNAVSTVSKGRAPIRQATIPGIEEP